MWRSSSGLKDKQWECRVKKLVDGCVGGFKEVEG